MVEAELDVTVDELDGVLVEPVELLEGVVVTLPVFGDVDDVDEVLTGLTLSLTVAEVVDSIIVIALEVEPLLSVEVEIIIESEVDTKVAPDAVVETAPTIVDVESRTTKLELDDEANDVVDDAILVVVGTTTAMKAG